jgi:hypothetical protein
VWRVTEARAEAKRLKQIVDQGGDPFGDMQAERDAPTVAELLSICRGCARARVSITCA